MPTMLISVFCPDRTGLVAAITGHLFDLGANLGDTSFAVLGSGAEFTALCDMPESAEAPTLERDLAALPETAGGKVSVTRFALDPVHGPSGNITHRVTIEGNDRPGLIARLSEAFGQYGANIVTLNAQFLPGAGAKQDRYAIRFGVNVPAARAESCLATIANTAEELQQSCRVEKMEK